jgi:hypothetical protein
MWVGPGWVTFLAMVSEGYMKEEKKLSTAAKERRKIEGHSARKLEFNVEKTSESAPMKKLRGETELKLCLRQQRSNSFVTHAPVVRWLLCLSLKRARLRDFFVPPVMRASIRCERGERRRCIAQWSESASAADCRARYSAQ